MALEFSSTDVVAYISSDAYSMFLSTSSKKFCKTARIVTVLLILIFSFILDVSTPAAHGWSLSPHIRLFLADALMLEVCLAE